MDETFRLGRISGIAIGVNWSVAIIFWLLTWSLADGLLPRDAPGYSTAAYWVAAVLAGIAFFLGLLAHELSHAVVARRLGLPVEGITLWLFGGVSKLGGDSPDASSEFRIAVVGPATSMGLAVVFAILAAALSSLGDLVVSTLVWLAGINALLAVFNMVPAFPLDGGRVLRSIVWRRRNDRIAATETAATAGRAFGYLLIGLGLLSTTGGEVVGGVWFIFLGWFLLTAARAEQSQVVATELLGQATIGDVMTRDPHTVPSSLDVDTLLHDHVLGRQHSAHPVVDEDGHPVGLVTLDSIRRVAPEARARTRVGTIAHPMSAVPVVAPGDPLPSVLPKLSPTTGGRALVIESGHLVGIVTATDIQRAIQYAELTRR